MIWSSTLRVVSDRKYNQDYFLRVLEVQIWTWLVILIIYIDVNHFVII